MADFFVRSTTGVDTNNGTSWALAKATLNGALAVAVAGDRIFVSTAHAETAAALKGIVSPGTTALPVQVYSANDGVPTPSTSVAGASVNTSGTNNINIDGSMNVYNMAFAAGNSLAFPTSTSVDVVQIYNDCSFQTITTNTASAISFGSSASTNAARGRVQLNNCSIRIGSFGARIQAYQEFTWRGGSYQGPSNQTHVFRSGSNGRGVPVMVEGVDFTLMGQGTNLVFGTNATGRFMFRNCLLPAGWTGAVVEGTHDPGLRVEMHNCDSGDTNYRLIVAAFGGYIRSETSILKTGGASDGLTNFSWKMETNSNPTTGLVGMESPEITRWNITVGTPITVTIDILPDSGTLTSAEAWLDVQYLGTSGSPKSSFVSSRPAPLAVGVTLASSSAVWPNGGARTPQKLSVTFTPQKAGVIHCKVLVAKPNAIVYVDPKVQVS